MGGDRKDERPFEGGAQPVAEHPPEAPKGGRTVAQTAVVVVVALVVIAAILWLIVPFGS